MKKYRVTDKHPFLKKDIILNETELDGKPCVSLTKGHSYGFRERHTWIEKEYIEEIQEPEFTKDDMINFGKWCDTGNQESNEIYEKALNQWIKD